MSHVYERQQYEKAYREKNREKIRAQIKAWKARSKPLRKMSKKNQAELKAYLMERDQFLRDHNRCEFPDWLILKSDIGLTRPCLQSSAHVHHVMGRGKMLRVQEHWLALCAQHHAEIHDNPNWARKVGLLKI